MFEFFKVGMATASGIAVVASWNISAALPKALT
jgi:hypothetical protein